ncbi:MAG: circadian clock KaiB family protein [Candidatus Accumulibacter sp. UW20]|jgi:circadian clock protein KaiB
MMPGDYQFRLFVAGGEANSRLAEQNLRALCNERLSGCHHIEVVDVLQDFEAALEARIMVAPTLLMVAPWPATFYGTLSNQAKLLAVLALEGDDHRS